VTVGGKEVTMTITDTLIPYYYWFKTGFGEMSLPLGLFNFATIIIIALTQKGIYIPLFAIPIIAVVVIIGCVFIGWFLQHYGINGRIATLVIQKQNPELDQLCRGVKELVDESRNNRGNK
jgi:hypothetical protein